MKRLLIAIFFIFSVAPCSAQWKSTGLDLQATAFGVHDTFLFACFSNGNGFIRIVPAGNWFDASNGIDFTQGTITSFASLGRYFYAEMGRAHTYRSSDEGTSWQPQGGGHAIASNGQYLFANYQHFFQGPYMAISRDSGGTWDSVASFSPRSFAINGICIYAVEDSGLQRSLDSGKTWTKLSTPFEPRSYTAITMGSVVFLDDNSSSNVTKYPGAVSMSTDSGLHWNPITVDSAGVKESVYCLATDGKNLFAGTGQGVFVSTDTGQTWKPMNDGFGRPNINLLCVFDTMLYANGGGSIWDPHTYKRPIREMLPPKSAVQQPVALRDTISIYPNPATGLVTILAGGTAIERVSVLSVLGVEVLTLDKPGGMSHNSEITLDLSHLPSGTYFLRIQAATGTVLRKVVRE